MGLFSGLKKFAKKAWGGVKKIGGSVAKTALGMIPGGSVLGSALGTIGGGIVGSVASGLGGAVSNKIFGTEDKAEREIEKSRQWTLDQSEAQTRLGNQLDLANQKEMYDYRINQGLDAGMTAYEMYQGPAGGAGGGTQGSGQTLGNAATQQGGIAAQQAFQAGENAKDREAKLAQTTIQTNAGIKQAEISAGATTGAATISSDTNLKIAQIKNAIEEGKLDLSKKQFQEITLPQAAAQLGLTKQQTRKVVNDVATSDPAFTLMMKRLSMGPDNMMVEFIQNAAGIDVTDRSAVSKLSQQAKRNFVTLVAALGSNIFKEKAGAVEALRPVGEALGTGAAKAVQGGSFLDSLKSIFPGAATSKPPTVGNGGGW